MTPLTSNTAMIQATKPAFPNSIPSVMLDPICDWKIPDWQDRAPSFMLTLWWGPGAGIMPQGDGECIGRN